MSLCRICGNLLGNKTLTVSEMYFGTKESFDYFECATCGCLQIANIPQNMAKYYPSNYGPHQRVGGQNDPKEGFRSKARTLWKRAFLDRQRLFNRLFIQVAGEPRLPPWLVASQVTPRSSILDVGCGDGRLLRELSKIGFENLLGIDRFVDPDNWKVEGVDYRRCEMRDLCATGASFDLVMMHHSLEHMADQHTALEDAKTLLSPGGRLVIRIPTKSSFAWREFGIDWFALDAPRHFYLHTEESVEFLTTQVGLSILEQYCDGTAQSLWASEQYRRGMPFMDTRSLRFGKEHSCFSEEEIADFTRMAQSLNEAGAGDAVCYVFASAS